MKGIIDLVSNDIVNCGDKYQIGFRLENHSNWENIKGPEGVLKSMKKDMIIKGNEIEFEIKEGYATNIVLISRPENKSDTPAPAIIPASVIKSTIKPASSYKPKKKFEDEMVKFEDLLTEAHKTFKDKFEIQTEMLQLDLEKKFALFKAVVTIERGKDYCQVFEGHGDATSENVKGLIAPHFIRMAETRSIVRALRWATNNAKCSEEEC